MKYLPSLCDTSGRYTTDEIEAIFKSVDEGPALVQFTDEPCLKCGGEGDALVPGVGLRACGDCWGTGKHRVEPEPKPGSIIIQFGDGA